MWPSRPVTYYNIPSYTGQLTHYNMTIWAGNPLKYTITKKKFLVFFNHRAGRLEQLDHSWNSSRFFYHRVGCPEQFDSFKKKKGSSLKWLVLSVKVMYQSTIFKVFFFLKKFFLYLLSFINLLHKAKRKWYFLISLHSKYYKEGATVITEFFLIFLF